jgi:hypothetical protein
MVVVKAANRVASPQGCHHFTRPSHASHWLARAWGGECSRGGKFTGYRSPSPLHRHDRAYTSSSIKQ